MAAIVLDQPAHVVMALHDRTPVILEPADWPAWLGEVDADPAALLHP
jgi:putative SOS response-associated peptidase YedK